MNIRFDGNRALVTGAGKGIGRDIALRLSEAGAEVVAISRTPADLQSLREEIGCETIEADLADPHAARQAAERAGDVQLLVNNAGVSIPQSFLETTIEAMTRTLAINLTAAMVIGQVVARRMIAGGRGGAIVNLSSQASKVGLQDHTAYCCSKGGLDQLTRVMALELGPHDIRVNCVNPTVTLTPMGEMAWGDPAKSGPMLAKIPLGRFANPSNVSDAVLYLLSDRADMITGTTLPVDGGFLAT
jgi:NAD(P)-dependent dehydrogenase (short-subunit alcohol dehydrogenase family)